MSNIVYEDLVLPVLIKKLNKMGANIRAGQVYKDRNLEEFVLNKLHKAFGTTGSMVRGQMRCDRLRAKIQEALQDRALEFDLFLNMILNEYMEERLPEVEEEIREKIKKKVVVRLRIGEEDGQPVEISAFPNPMEEMQKSSPYNRVNRWIGTEAELCMNCGHPKYLHLDGEGCQSCGCRNYKPRKQK